MERQEEQRQPWQISVVGWLGIALFLSEIWKQWYLFFEVNRQEYNWWYFPFQLCSLPIYLAPCLLILRDKKKKQMIADFLHDFNMLGAIAVFLDTSGMMHVRTALTIHSFTFHICLIVIGILIHSCNYMDISWKGFGKTVGLFMIFAGIAVGLNGFIYPRINGDINMFYVNCYYPNTQIVFKQINEVLPTWATNGLYLLTIVVGAGIMHALKRLTQKMSQKSAIL
ncbi:MAG: hypothetical protein ACI4C1_03625 [Lachnospiraceae bacterium]